MKAYIYFSVFLIVAIMVWFTWWVITMPQPSGAELSLINAQNVTNSIKIQ